MPDTPNLTALAGPRLKRGWRLFWFFTSALVLTGGVSMLFADLLWRTGWSASRTVLLVLFIILFSLTAIGCMHGVYGFFIRLFGTQSRVTALRQHHSTYDLRQDDRNDDVKRHRQKQRIPRYGDRG